MPSSNKRDLVGFGVAEQPFVGVQAVVFRAQIFDHFVDIVAILNGFARAISDRRAVDVERALVDGGFGKHHAGIVLIPVRSALDAAGIALHQDAMSGDGLDVEHHVGLLGQRERPPGGVADNHAAVASGGSSGGEGAAMVRARRRVCD